MMLMLRVMSLGVIGGTILTQVRGGLHGSFGEAIVGDRG
jgi:hypothetical protein